MLSHNFRVWYAEIAFVESDKDKDNFKKMLIGTTTCGYYNPVDIGTTSARTTQFGSSTCIFEFENSQNTYYQAAYNGSTSTGSSTIFAVNNTWTPGEIVIAGLLALIAFCLFVMVIKDMFLKKKVAIYRHTKNL